MGVGQPRELCLGTDPASSLALQNLAPACRQYRRAPELLQEPNWQGWNCAWEYNTAETWEHRGAPHHDIPAPTGMFQDAGPRGTAVEAVGGPPAALWQGHGLSGREGLPGPGFSLHRVTRPCVSEAVQLRLRTSASRAQGRVPVPCSLGRSPAVCPVLAQAWWLPAVLHTGKGL